MSLLSALRLKRRQPTEDEIEAAVARELRGGKAEGGACPNCGAPESRQQDVDMSGTNKICAECMTEYSKGRA